MSTRVFIVDTAATTFLIPSDFTNSNTIEAIGAGGGGNAGGNAALEAGAGGEYRIISGVTNTPGSTISISVGIGGIGGTGSGTGSDGGSTNWDSGVLIAIGGDGGGTGGIGGQGGTGGSGYNGGNSGQVGVVFTGSGGGGAAGPHGAGAVGGDSGATGAAPGGGGSGGGSVGQVAVGTTGGNGGANYTASQAGGAGGTSGAGNGGPGTGDSNGASGGGGAGQASGATGGVGGSGQEWDATHGSGGGGGSGGTAGGSSAGPAGNGGLYGGGGGCGASLGDSAGGDGGQGIIVVTYTSAGLAILRPDANISTGTWTTEAGASTLYASINEVVAVDTNFIQSVKAPSNDVCEVSLQNQAGDVVAPFKVRYRYKKQFGQNIDLVVNLIQGTTVVTTWTHNNITTSIVQVEQTLTAPEAANVTDVSDLRIRFTASVSVNATITANFLARTTGLDATHTNAYKAFIDGLVADGLCTDTTWGKFDCIYLFGTQTSAAALLNLPSATYNATATGSPTFTADQGYTGAASKYISTGFTPSTASSPNFTQNTASIGIYDRTSRTSASSVQMGTYDGAGKDTEITLWYGDNIRYFPVNGTGASDGAAAATQGSWFSNRSASNATQVYYNGTSLLTGSQTSGAVSTREMLISCLNNAGTPANFSTDQIAAAWIGGNFTATEIVNFQSRLNTFATTLGWNTY